MEKMITIITEVAVATIVLFGLVALASILMQEPSATNATGGAIYAGLNSLITQIFDSASSKAGITITP